MLRAVARECKPTAAHALARLQRAAPLAEEEIAAIESATRGARVLRPGAELAREGREPVRHSLLLGGWLAHHRILSGGRRQITGFTLPGETFGLYRLREGAASTSTMALEAVAFCPAPPAEPGSALERAYEAGAVEQHARAIDNIARLGRMNARERLYDLLLELTERLRLSGIPDRQGFAVPLTQECLADALGLTPVHVNRTLQACRAAGDITWTDGRVQIHDAGELARRMGRTFSDGTVVTYSTPSPNVLEINNSQTGSWRITRSGTNLSVRKPGRTTDTLTVIRDSQYRVTSLTDDGVTRTYNWSSSGGNTVVNIGGGASGSGTVVSPPSVGQPATVTNAVNATVVQTYDSNNREIRTTFPEGNYIEHTRDGRGNITQTIHVPKPGSGQSPITTIANYEPGCSNQLTCNKPNFTIDGRGNRTDYTYSSTHGQLTRVQLPAPASGQPRPQVDYTYTALTAAGQSMAEYKLTQITSCATAATCAGTANETKVTIAYNTPKLLTSSVTVASGNGAISATTSYTYDADDNVASVDGPLPGGEDAEYFFYDSHRRPIGAIGPDPDGAGGNPRPASRVTYNAAGQVTKLESGTVTGTSHSHLNGMAVLRTIDATFDGNGRKTVETLGGSDGVIAQLVQYSYDSAGRLECTALRMNPAAFGSLPSSACSLGAEGSHGPDRITKLHYDAAGRPIRQESGVGTAAVGNDAVTSYTANGKVFTATDGENNTTTYEYDGFDRLTKLRLPVTTQGAGTSSTVDFEQYTYDANGNLTTRRTRADETLTFVYDALDRLISKIVPERSGLSPTHTRDVYYGYDLMGRPSFVRFDSVSGEGLAYVFDALGRMTSETLTMDGVSRTLTSGYDAAGMRVSLAYPDGNYVSYYRDSLGRVNYGGLNGSGNLFYSVYAADGRRSALYRLLVSSGVWGWSEAANNFSYDGAGRLSGISTGLAGTSADTIVNFTRNPAGQIASLTQSNDAYAWTGAVNVDRGYTVNGLNQYTAAGPASFAYDANGNLTSDGSNSYQYDVENRLVVKSGALSATLRYDPLGRLYELNGLNLSGTIRMLHDGDALVAEYNVHGEMIHRYVHGPAEGADDPLVWFTGASVSDSARRYLFSDERGSIVAVTDANGNALAINAYDEYGIPGAGNIGRFQYTGQAWLPDLGLYYYKARMYSPTLGRFMQTDPIGYADGMNWYAYVGNDPINSVDPLGLATEIVVEARRLVGCDAPGARCSSPPGALSILGVALGGGQVGWQDDNLGDPIVVTARRPRRSLMVSNLLQRM